MRRISCIVTLAFCIAAILPGQSQSQGSGTLPVLSRVDVTVLVENMAGNPSLLGEWGLSFLIETGKHRVLLDTGGGRTLIENARALKVDLSKLDAIVISHGHFDHTGGLEKTLQACGPVDLFIHPAAFATRYFKEGSRVVKDENPLSPDGLRGRVRNLHETLKPTAVCEGLMVTGEVPRENDFEDTGVGNFIFLDPELKAPDLVPDDQAVYFRVPEGVVILLGCAHAGVINTARYVSKLAGGEKIYAVMGGTHLISASPARIQKTIEALRELGVQKILLSHCTGVNAYAELAKAFPGRCAWPPTGARIHFGGAMIPGR
jgi:7,8-dihydropterin-6-yl-methyl-4-(beta-D-ribofuranosyl)aminobenzene 5'-phosphate synthase